MDIIQEAKKEFARLTNNTGVLSPSQIQKITSNWDRLFADVGLLYLRNAEKGRAGLPLKWYQVWCIESGILDDVCEDWKAQEE